MIELKELSDGSIWLKVLYHNNPASNMFTSSNAGDCDSDNLMSKLSLLTTGNFMSAIGYYEFLVL